MTNPAGTTSPLTGTPASSAAPSPLGGSTATAPATSPSRTFDDEMLRILSRERIYTYQATADKGDRRLALARYLRNAALSAAITPALHAVEVTLRNALYASIEAHVYALTIPQTRTYPDLPSWLDYRPTLLHGRGEEIVDAAKESHHRAQRKLPHKDRKRLTTGHLIAELTFGFWVSLLAPAYENHRDKRKIVLWPTLTPAVFPGEPRYDVVKKTLIPQLEDLVRIRNRIAHHEPIWQMDLPRLWTTAVTILGHMSPAAEQLVRDTDRLAAILKEPELSFLRAIRHY